MNKSLSVIKTILLWVFVAFCLLMAIGCGSLPGSSLFVITAVITAPLKIVRNLWDKVLGIKEIPALADDTPAKWYQAKKKKEQKQHNNAIEDQKKRKLFKPMIIVVVFMIAFMVAIGDAEPANNTDSLKESTETEVSQITEKTQETIATTTTPESTATPMAKETPKLTETPDETETPNETEVSKETATPTPEVVAELSQSFELSKVPAYSGSPYVSINGNVPYFTDSEMSAESYEYYSDLDSMGRCWVCVASVGKDIMPTGERGEIGSVKPTGWKTVKYAGVVDGNYLYNRCHLLGWQLTGENANTKNLITGTRYMNVQGMLPFENMVADYVKETGNHVMYRVTPIFAGNNLVASGVLMEAKSVEDSGNGVLFNVYCYNVQPGVTIDYATGDSALEGTVATEETKSTPESETTQSVTTPAPVQQEQTPVAGGGYAVNSKNGKIHIVGGCPATGSGDNAMTSPVYFNTYEEAEAYSVSIKPSLDKRKCGNCW